MSEDMEFDPVRYGRLESVFVNLVMGKGDLQTMRPAQMGPALIDPLRELGMSKTEVIALFPYAREFYRRAASGALHFTFHGDFQEDKPMITAAPSGYDGRWKLCARDIEVLEEVKDYIWSLRANCKTGHELMGVGAAVKMIETILEGEMPEGFVGFSVEGTEGEEDDGEVTLTLDVGYEDISMGGIAFWDFGSGRDHESTSSANLSSEGGFETDKVTAWLRRANRLNVRRLSVDWDGVKV